MKALVILDGTSGGGDRQAQGLAAFLREGLAGDVQAETLIFYSDQRDRERLIGLSPTCTVRLARMQAWRPDRIVEALADVVRREDVSLLLFGPGPWTAGLAARLACRSGGSLLTGALDVAIGEESLVCHKTVYSAHMTGRFELTSRPWCVGIDASWNDSHPPICRHVIISETDGSTVVEPSPFEDLELVDMPPTGDLIDNPFLVIAGRGAGDRGGAERVAAAARRMGAAFGVTRPAAMNAWAPLDRIVGVSGSRAAPAVCIVVGASGAPAFYWGIEKARFIIAINEDERAPIVRNADVVVVDDGPSVIEELAKLIGPDAQAG